MAEEVPETVEPQAEEQPIPAEEAAAYDAEAEEDEEEVVIDIPVL